MERPVGDAPTPDAVLDPDEIEVPGKPQVFMPYVGGVRGYRRILERVEGDGYDGFVFSPALVPSP